MPEPHGAIRIAIAVWVLLVGAAVGSFLNVVIGRVPAGESIVRPRSRCPRCGAAIRWYDNIPIASWIALRARCRSCRAPISIRYPIVEGLGAMAALLAWSRHGLSIAAVAELAVAAALIALAFIDLDTWLLPHAITWPVIASGLAFAALGAAPSGSLRLAAYGAGLGFGSFALLSWLGAKVFKKEALGFGDVWLLGGLGAWMGPAALLPVVLFASLQGSVVGIALIVLGKGQPGPTATESARPAPTTDATRKSTTNPATDDDWVPPRHVVPFGPFLVAGALEWLWLGDVLARGVTVLALFR